MNFLNQLSEGINAFNRGLGKIISWLTLVMAIVMFMVVVLRYGFNLGWIAMQESVTYLHAAVFLMGAAYTLQLDGHVRVDVFYRSFSKRRQALVNLFGAVFFLLPVSVFITYVSYDYVIESWLTLESSMESGGIPFLYVLKSFILVFSITLLLQGISEIISNVITFLNSNSNNGVR